MIYIHLMDNKKTEEVLLDSQNKKERERGAKKAFESTKRENA